MSNKVINLLFEAKQQGIEIVLNEGQLHVRLPKNTDFDKNILEEIKGNKLLIVDFLARQNKADDYATIPAFNRKEVEHIPLSFSQERLWFIHRLEGSFLYHLITILRLRGKLNESALSYAMEQIVYRHEVLRTVFREDNGQAYQHIKSAGDWRLTIEDGSGLSSDVAGLQDHISLLARKPFDLSNDYMVRATLIRLLGEDHVLVVTMHHIASDAWSMPIIVREVAALYLAFESGQESGLAPLELQYADYALWQRNYLQGEVLEKKLGYWKQKLAGVEPLGMATDFARPAVRSNRGDTVVFKVEKELTGRLQEMSQHQESSLFMTLLSAYNILMYRYSGQGDIAVGTSIANRSRQEVEGLIGFFVNTLALRTELSDELSFTEVLSRVRSTTMEAYEHQDVPFEKVVEAVVKDRDPGRSPLFQVMLVLLNTPEAGGLQLGGLALSREPFVSKVSKFDITFFINETGGMLHGAVEYSTDLYMPETIERMAIHFKELLASIVKAPAEKIGRLKLLSKPEEEQLGGGTVGGVSYAKDKTVVDLFEEQVSGNPGAMALVFEGGKLSYQDLNGRANRLAHTLVGKGVKEGTLVPLFIDRGIEMIVGILGILKAGGAYVPIDTAFPRERVGYMLEDAGAKVVVSSKASRDQLPGSYTGQVVEIENNAEKDRQEDGQKDKQEDNLARGLSANGLAYVIYTSGSTGNPKGVMVTHQNLVDYTLGLEEKTGISKLGPFALVSTIATDLGNTVIYGSLLLGGELHVFSRESVSDSHYLHSYFRDHEIGCLKIVPSHWKALSSEGLLVPKHLLVFGGEALGSDIIETIKKSGAGCRIINHYGPTETTIGKLLHEVEGERKYGRTIPIGKVFSNTRVYVLSKELELSGIGVPGELFIAGDGVARGYWNNEELTKEKFINNPFDRDNDNKDNNDQGLMYGTGDRVRMLGDGSIEFLGRIDAQVKIRGYRIEPQEVEEVLSRSELVSQAVVVGRADRQGNLQLIAYVVGGQSWFDREGIVSYLKDQLPEYMVPSVLVEVERIPLTANGKVDRKGLPDPDQSGQLSGRYEGPRNEAERRLAVIWQEVLEVDEVGVHDDFFELGGHSLLAVRLISAIRKELEVEMPISDIFDYPTIASLSGQLELQSAVGVLPKVKAISPRPERTPLSFSQERLWFIDRLEGTVQYHVPAVLRLKGRVNVEGLEKALGEIVRRHEVLRTVFREEDGEAFQVVKEAGSWALKKTEGKGYRGDEDKLKIYIKDQISKVFDLSADDMLRAELICLDEEEHVLLVTLHHIASDAWSRSIIVKEFVELYEAYEEGREPKLSELEVQYGDYAIWQRGYLQGEVLEGKLGYWKEKLKGVSPLQLPLDNGRPAVQSSRGAMRGFMISKEEAAGLQKLSHEEGTTMFMTMLTAFKVLLYRYSGQEDICVGTPVAGRQQQEVESLIGFFINTLALRSEVKGDQSFRELLHEVRRSTLEAYEHQEVPFEKVVETVVKERELSRTPLFQVMFVVNNAPEIPALKLGGVQLQGEDTGHNTSKFEMVLSITETNEGLAATLEYNTDLFNEGTIGQMIAHFIKLLSSIVKEPEELVGKLKMLRAEDEHRLLKEFNDTSIVYANDKTLVSLFEEQVQKNPSAVALISGEIKKTYKELNEDANQLAHYLIENGLKPGELVPICYTRNFDMVTGLLAILKAGGAYVPFDPVNPQERISYMLTDIGAHLALTASPYIKKLQHKGTVKVINTDTMGQAISKQKKKNIQIDRSPNDIAYVIYTSGSTGLPKGVLIEHSSVVNLIDWHKRQYEVDASSRATAMAGVGFDAFGWEIWPYLSSGASVSLIDDETRLSPPTLVELFIKQKITHSFISTALIPDFLEASRSKTSDLKYLTTGGDKLSAPDLQGINFKLVNNYGPTENTVVATSYLIDINEKHQVPPIGKPISNTKIYILNQQDELVPIGSPGQICIGGSGLARGYLNQEKLTSDKFIRNIFLEPGGSKLYKTGDLGRWLGDGNIEFLGRIDDQVKIRGNRIELGEIETVLLKTGLVSQAIVLAKDIGQGKHLVAYVVRSKTFSKEAVKKFLSWKLPEYMIPTIYVELESLPLTINGKIDKNALPDLNVSDLPTHEYIEPKGEIELKLAAIWKEILKVNRVGTKDNFFELGGHSILALKIISRMTKELNKPLPLSSLFENPTIEKFATMLSGDNKGHKSKSLIEIKAGSTKTPFYIVCGAGGTVYTFKKFAAMMNPEQSVYGLQQPSGTDITGKQDFPESIEEIATKYISEIIEQNPSGPYSLSGHCTGGFVAFEMAKQLKAMGKEVNYLALFDTIIQVQAKGTVGTSGNLNRIPEITKRVFSKISLKLKFELYLLRHHTRQAILYKFFKVKKRIYPAEYEDSLTESFDHVSKVYLAARNNYKVSLFDGEMVVFYAKDHYYFMDIAKKITYKKYQYNHETKDIWRQYARVTKFYEIDGEHSTIFNSIHTKKFATLVQKSLNSIVNGTK